MCAQDHTTQSRAQMFRFRFAWYAIHRSYHSSSSQTQYIHLNENRFRSLTGNIFRLSLLHIFGFEEARVWENARLVWTTREVHNVQCVRGIVRMLCIIPSDCGSQHHNRFSLCRLIFACEPNAMERITRVFRAEWSERVVRFRRRHDVTKWIVVDCACICTNTTDAGMFCVRECTFVRINYWPRR